MLNSLLDTAATRVCEACEIVRRLENMVSKEAVANSEQNRFQQNALARTQTFSSIESDGVARIVQSQGLISNAIDGFGKSDLQLDMNRATRSINGIGNGITQISALSSSINQAVGSLAGGDVNSLIRGIGGPLATSISNATGALSRLRQALTAKRNPLPPAFPQVGLLASLQPMSLNRRFVSGLPAAGNPNSHLLVLTASNGQSFYFNLSTAGFNSFKRQSAYNIASQDRLTRRPALQAVSKGGESITVSGAIFTKQSGAGQLEKLRAIGFSLSPVNLVTGYGEALGQWYLTRIEEEQEALFTDGMPRKQQFTLEFQRYGEDYSRI